MLREEHPMLSHEAKAGPLRCQNNASDPTPRFSKLVKALRTRHLKKSDYRVYSTPEETSESRRTDPAGGWLQEYASVRSHGTEDC